jgi:3-oxoacyl-[acyl-carrier-protein] synthase III
LQLALLHYQFGSYNETKYMYLLKPFFQPIGRKTSNDDALILASKGSVSLEELRAYLNKTGSDIRYLDFQELSLLEEGAKALVQVIDINQIALDDVEGIIYTGVFKEHYEPSVASLLAKKLGLYTVRTFDINSACASAAQAMELATLLLQRSRKSCFLIVSVDLPSIGLDWEINHLPSQGVALTLGAASSALVVSRNHVEGSVELKRFVSINNALYAESSAALIGGYFHAFSDRLLRPLLASIPEVKRIVQEMNKEKCWILPHQPSVQIDGLKDMLRSESTEVEVCVTHQNFGNTGVSSWISAYQQMLSLSPRKGDGVLIYSFAAGFSSVIISGELV